MKISQEEATGFQDKFKWMNGWMTDTMGHQVTVTEVLAAIMVMEKEDPVALIEIMREMEKEKNE